MTVAVDPAPPSEMSTDLAPPRVAPRPAARPSWRWLTLTGVTLALAATLLFFGLGSQVFWDDEAATALGAQAIMRTGGNTALLGNGNVVAYHNGNALVGFDNRLEPLLPAYTTAAAFEVLGVSTWAGRVPFALFGLGTFALLMLWTRHEGWQVTTVVALAALGNVSLILYCRNCRYYAPAIFFSVALAYVYQKVRPTVGSACGFAALSILLFTSNYLNYLAFYVCLGVDYLVWQRRRAPWSWRQLGCVFLPQLVVNGVIGSIWNPLRTAHADNLAQNTLWNRLTLFYWQWRDMNICEAICLPLLCVALAVGLARRRTLLVRGCVALAVYVAIITLISPQIVAGGFVADVRYLTPIIPLAIGLEAAILCLLLGKRPGPLLAAALLIFGTNFVNRWFVLGPATRSTFVYYLHELSDPPQRPYAATAEWVRRNVPAGSSVLVRPGYAMYPLMFYAPQALYAWQFQWPPRPGYASLPDIHFEGQVAPDYVIASGPYLTKTIWDVHQMLKPGQIYQELEPINMCWLDCTRPEMFWHLFTTIRNFHEEDTIHVFRRLDAPRPVPSPTN